MNVQANIASVTVDRAEFAAAVAKVIRVVARRNSIPILDCLLITAEEGCLSVEGNDLDLRMVARMAATVASPVCFAIPGHKLNDLLKKTKTGVHVSITVLEDAIPGSAQVSVQPGSGVKSQVAVKEKPGKVLLDLGAMRLTLDTRAAGDWPSESHKPLFEPTNFEFDTADLAKALGKVAFAMSKEETRYYLNGVLMEHEEGAVNFVATDGHRLSRYVVQKSVPHFPPIILPRETVVELARIASAKHAPERLRFEIAQNGIVAAFGPCLTVASKNVDGTYLDYRRVIPNGMAPRLLFNCEALDNAVAQVSIVRDFASAVRIVCENNRANVSMSNPYTGKAESTIETYDNAPADFGINSAYLREAIAHISGETLTIAYQDAGAPLRFYDDDDAALTIIVTPMRV